MGCRMSSEILRMRRLQANVLAQSLDQFALGLPLLSRGWHVAFSACLTSPMLL